MSVAAVAQLKPVAKMDKRELAEELLGIERKHGMTFARMDDLKAALRKLATDAGAGFKEDFPGKGVVKVAGGHDGKFQGIMPEVHHERFLALPEKERNKLTAEEDGVITMAAKYGRPFYGSVTVELF